MTSGLKLTKGDIPFSSATGRPLLVEGLEKLRQDVRENLETEAQRDGTGADIDGVVSLLGDVFSLRAEISRRVVDSLTALKRVQDSVQRFDRTNEEKFARLANLVVVPIKPVGSGDISGTDYAFRVDVLSVAGATPVTVSGTLG